MTLLQREVLEALCTNPSTEHIQFCSWGLTPIEISVSDTDPCQSSIHTVV